MSARRGGGAEYCKKTALEPRESQDLKYSDVRARRTKSIRLLDTVRLSSLATGLGLFMFIF